MGAPISEGVDISTASQSESKTNNTDDAALSTTYTSLIQQYLSMLCFDNALFLAERFVAHQKTNESLYLLALCHYRNGSPQSAKAVLEQQQQHQTDSTSAASSMQYLLAKCHYDLHQYGRAEDALLVKCRNLFRSHQDADTNGNNDNNNMDEWILSTTPCPIPNGAAGLHLLGEICRSSNRKDRAMQYYRMSLKLDPMMWSSYEALCELGAGDDLLDPVQIFGVCPTVLTLPTEQSPVAESAQMPPPREERGVLTPSFGGLHQTPMDSAVAAAGGARPMDLTTPMSTTPSSSSFLPKASLFPSSASSVARNSSKPPRPTSFFETPNLTPIPTEKSMMSAAGFVNPVVVKRANRVASRLYYPPSPETASPSSSKKPRSLFLGGLGDNSMASTRRSSLGLSKEHRMMETTPKEPQGGSRGGDALFAPVEERSTETGGSSTAAAETIEALEIDEDSVKSILELLCILGAAHKQLCQYRCREAIQIFRRLPQEQFHTGWVLHQVGRAYFETADYQNAMRYLEMMQQTEPHRIKGLEVLSTTLWQLKKEVQLSHLAQRAIDFDRLCPESWCVVGNCFSLQKDHEAALTFFRRSIQLDPSFTYSHTLSGHEYMAVEDFEKAKACYRDAIRADERHYNAWYGLGTIYFRQEQYELAEYHFRRAITINPQSAVLLCHLGLAQNNNGKHYEALDTFSLALKVSPRNPQARYQRANIYTALDRPLEALAELEKVRDLCPREASVHYGMGKVLKRLGRTEQAMRCFLIALDLEPKDTNLSIKAAMEKMDEPDIPEEEISAY